MFLSQLEDEHHQIALAATNELPATKYRITHCAFRLGSFSELTELYQQLTVEDEPFKVFPITHGNTWSIYFSDLEDNGIKVFCDTPCEIHQPYAKPWDPDLAYSELYSTTKAQIEHLPGFGPNSRLAKTKA